LAWDTDSIEEAVLLATSIREDVQSDGSPNERSWAVGIAEGELEPLAPDGARMQLAWGQALLLAATLSRVARGGEVLIDGDLRALRAGQLSLLGARTATDVGLQVRGWRLDIENPWKRPAVDGIQEDEIEELEIVEEPAASPAPPPVASEEALSDSSEDDLAGATMEIPAPEFDGAELSAAEVLEIVEASAAVPSAPTPAPEAPNRGGKLAHRVRRLAAGDKSKDAMEAIAELRRERARVEQTGTPSSRCQAALALAMTLAIAGRAEDALLEALDALARARDAGDPKAIDACTALLAKLYSGAGHQSEASALLRGA
jgi:hypothetical protein